MKYQPPFVPGATPGAAGIYNSNPDAGYVNGDPSTGQEGSYFPGEALEHTMREIVGLITKSGQTPLHTDLAQLAKGVAAHAAGGSYAGTCTGAANDYTVAATGSFAVPLAPFTGQIVITTPPATNTGPAVADVFGYGDRALRTFADAALAGNEIASGRPTAWQYSTTANGGAGAWLILPWADAIAVALADRPTVKMLRAHYPNFSVPNNLVTVVNFTAGTIPVNDFGTGLAGGTTFTIPETGHYTIIVRGNGTTGTYADVDILIGANFRRARATAGGSQYIVVTYADYLTAGTNIQARLFQNDGATRTWDAELIIMQHIEN